MEEKRSERRGREIDNGQREADRERRGEGEEGKPGGRREEAAPPPPSGSNPRRKRRWSGYVF